MSRVLVQRPLPAALPLAIAWLLTSLALVPSPALAHVPVLERVYPMVSEYFGLGVEHILSGLDHLLFLAALVLGAARVRDAIYAVSMFTLAHSITLALGVLGLVHPNPLGVEVLIALSIAYVAFENLHGRSGKARLAATLAFGLVHGLGFASALGEVGVSPDRMLGSLLCFNLGVEAGQLGVLVLLLPAVRWLKLGGTRSAMTLRALSATLVAVGVLWAAERLLEPPADSTAVAAAGAATGVPTSRALARAGEPSAQTPRSVYPRAAGAPTDDVKRVCAALSALPRERRAACAGRRPGIVLTSECERMLGAALADGAVSFAPGAAERCVADQHARYASCAFAEATALIPLPSCSGMLLGQRARGESCRSSLECGSGLHCSGASPVEAGTCAAPGAPFARCSLSTDALGAYLPSRDADHPECAGSCIRNRCAARADGPTSTPVQAGR